MDNTAVSSQESKREETQTSEKHFRFDYGCCCRSFRFGWFQKPDQFYFKNLIKVKTERNKDVEVRKKLKMIMSEAMRKLYNLLS